MSPSHLNHGILFMELLLLLPVKTFMPLPDLVVNSRSPKAIYSIS